MGGGLGRVTKHHRYYLSDGSVSFLTGNTLFKVHKSFFERESEVFHDLFESAAADDPLVGTDARPFTLDVTGDDFAQLLWVWYDGEYSYRHQTKANWITILGLSSRWKFPKIKELAIRELDALGLSPAERISIYNEHGIDDDRLFNSYVELCKSPVLTEADGRFLEMETLINILQAREDAQRKAAGLGHESPTSASLEDESLREIVSRFFKKGLDPRSDGTSTGSGVQASHLNGEHPEKTSTSKTVTLGEPQVPDRRTQSTSGPSSHMSNNPHKVEEKPQAGEGETKETEEKGREKARQDREREEKEKQGKAKEKAEKERMEKARQEKEKEKEAREKALKTEEQKRPQTPGRRSAGGK